MNQIFLIRLKKIFTFKLYLIKIKFFFYSFFPRKKIKICNTTVNLANTGNLYYDRPSIELSAYKYLSNFKEIEIIKKEIFSNGVCVDIGENIGFFSLLLLKKVCRNGFLYSFEKNKIIFNLLKKNLRNFKNLRLYHGEVGIKKNQIVIDKIIKKKIDLIKIDIDGLDLLALKSCKQIIGKHKPKILIELSENSKDTHNIHYSSVIKFLNKYNYSIYDINKYPAKFNRKLYKNEVVNIFCKI
jgi:hypothetical protein